VRGRGDALMTAPAEHTQAAIAQTSRGTGWSSGAAELSLLPDAKTCRSPFLKLDIAAEGLRSRRWIIARCCQFPLPSPIPCSTPLFHVRTSEIHGVGLFATLALQANTRLGAYEGRRMSSADVEATNWEGDLTYLFGLSDGTVIDGAQGGNALRHLNRSCNPNCEAVEAWALDGTLRLNIITLCDVRTGEELCLDYALTIDAMHAPEAYPCACSSVECRGTMAASA
jgi:hypothetical protein